MSARMDDEAMRPEAVAKFLCMKRAGLYSLLNRDPKFPRGAKIGKYRLWMKSDLLAYLSEKQAGE